MKDIAEDGGLVVSSAGSCRMRLGWELDIAYPNNFHTTASAAAVATIENGGGRSVRGKPFAVVCDVDIGIIGEDPVYVVGWLWGRHGLTAYFQAGVWVLLTAGTPQLS